MINTSEDIKKFINEANLDKILANEKNFTN